MHTILNSIDTLKKTTWCTIRPQEQLFVVYSSRTDELHLLSPTAYYVYQLCDGINTVGDLESILLDAFVGERNQVRQALFRFLECLLSRGILELER